MVEAPSLGWVSHVTRVEQQAQHSALVQAGAVVTARQDCLHLLQLREMHRHIWKYEGRQEEINALSGFLPTRVKNHVYHQTATLSEVLSGHIIEDVAFIINHNSE